MLANGISAHDGVRTWDCGEHGLFAWIIWQPKQLYHFIRK